MDANNYIARESDLFLRLFTTCVCITLLSNMISGSVIYGYTVTKLFALSICLLGALLVVKSRRVMMPWGISVMMVVATIPSVLHGYINTGLLLHLTLAVLIASANFDLKKVLHSCILFLVIIYVLSLIGISLTGDIEFSRNLNFPVDIYNHMPFFNPNSLARLVLVMIPILLMSYSLGIFGRKTLILLLLGAFIIIGVVAGSRANLVAVVIMLLYWFFTVQSSFEHCRYIQKIAVGLGLVLSLLYLPGVQDKFERGYFILNETGRLINTSESGLLDDSIAPARSKTWAASVLLVKQSPWVGVGYHADELIAEIGAVNQAGKNIAVHGGLMNVVTSGGFIGLVLFLIALSLLYKSFGIYGRMLLMGGLVSQFGADIYSLTGFWIVVGICLFYDRKHKELQEKKNSTSYPKIANM